MGKEVDGEGEGIFFMMNYFIYFIAGSMVRHNSN